MYIIRLVEWWDNDYDDNDNENILFDNKVQIYITDLQ